MNCIFFDLAQDLIKEFQNHVCIYRKFNSQKKTSEQHRTTVEFQSIPLKLHSSRIPTRKGVCGMVYVKGGERNRPKG